ncbi:MFS polyamine transporter [Roridomyces roridus]|uniref:MFS polyamine transporter n=1 Tax=Roridomyces roridus TaxID=1738132 RepID=A0AAD7CCB6_9AGAR|nr:MFS polyamine transporter [Roridomyces roridus]
MSAEANISRDWPDSTVNVPQAPLDSEKDAAFTGQSQEPEDLIVDWEGPGDPLNPRNWSRRKKWAATITASAFTFVSPVSSSMIAPGSDQVAHDFGVTNEVVVALFTSIFILSYDYQFLGPLSEIFGRNRIIQGANLWYLVWNLACGFAQNTGELLAFRFLAGIGGSAPLAIGGGVLGDIWSAEERGQAVAIYTLAPLLGPVVGPICGAYIAQKSNWRWVFWSTTIVTVGVQMLGVLYLRESYAPFLLEQKAKRIRKSMDSEKGPVRIVKSKLTTDDRTWKNVIKIALTRPFVLFYYEPIVQLLAIYMSYLYGLFYLFLTSMPLMFQGTYGQSVGASGLHYLALGIGVSGASQIGARLMDYIYRVLKQRYGGVGQPEFRLPSMVPGSILLPIGFLITGWAVQAKVHWIVADIGIVFIGAGSILNFQSIQMEVAYIIDAFTTYAASALAAAYCLRALCGFAFPLFAESMYDKLGYGKGNTVLAVVAIAIGCPAPILLWRYGKQVRMKSRFAKHAVK